MLRLNYHNFHCVKYIYRNKLHSVDGPPSQQPLEDQGLLIIEASQPHSDSPHLLGLLWVSDQPDGLDHYPTTHNTHKRQTSMPQWDLNLQSQHVNGHRHTLGHVAAGISY